MTVVNGCPTLTINVSTAREHWLEGMLRHEIGKGQPFSFYSLVMAEITSRTYSFVLGFFLAIFDKKKSGVPVVAQWVKNITLYP